MGEWDIQGPWYLYYGIIVFDILGELGKYFVLLIPSLSLRIM